MNHQEQVTYLLGYIKATIESLCPTTVEDKSSELFDLLADFEQRFNQEIKRIFS